ncbi:putative 2-aminoethylphosphonate ABC transporter permease subunit [Cetobacterium sp. 2G large]|uniref:putative 2-aminoethylphosphonate ABC transporter permease subunit n=1 Tax=Cetobacterium sp. 2G large TaxID=2759680 RepID=UPI00163CAC54|nr:putative 2-aminoethylphosphonate ABC transporter permease subunit [Cetobacterium sp. 2G large]MBC2852522.1 putative 2-aminoethylphosphonate ABC transporter permease subunit [Cetobacterium sp. 2G large]
MKKEQILKYLLILFGIIFLCIGIIFPLGTLFIKAFYSKDNIYIGMQNFSEYINNPNSFSSLINSFKVAVVVTLITTIIALLFAYGLNRSKIRGKRFLEVLVLLPLFSPTMTHGIGLIYIFGRQGLVTRYLGINLEIYGFLGIILAEIIFIFPVLFLMYSLGFKVEDYRTYEVAELMGIGKIKQFFTITIPNIKYSLITGIFTAFTLSFTDFGAPKVIGGNFNVLATDIFKQVIGQQNMSMGATIGIILLIPAIIAFCVDLIFQKKQIKIDTRATKYLIKENKKRDVFYTIFNYGIIIINLVFLGVILLSSLVKNWPYNMSLTTKSYNFTIMGESVWTILLNSIFVSVFTAILGTVICFNIAYFIEREKENKILRKVAYFLSILPNAIPGLTIGLAYIFFFNSKNNPLNFLYGTFGILIIANIIHFFATPFLTITSNLKKLDKEYEVISDLMGVSWYKTVYKVIVPLSLEALLESFSYYFINSMITISAVIFLYTTDTRLISVMMISKSDSGDISAASAIAIMIIIINICFKLCFKTLVKYIKDMRYKNVRKDKIEREKKAEKLLIDGREILEILNGVSNETKVKYWLEFGTLLGKVRDNNFIGHDVNFDIGIMKDEITADFLVEIESKGFKRVDSLRLEDSLKYLKYLYKEIEVEIFLFERLEDKVFTYYKNNDDEIMGYKLSNSTLEEVRFMGIETRIPRNSTKRLIEIYGENYNQPDPSWKDEMSPHIFKI